MRYQERQVVSSVFTVKRQKKVWEALEANSGGNFVKFFPLFRILRKKYTYQSEYVFFLLPTSDTDYKEIKKSQQYRRRRAEVLKSQIEPSKRQGGKRRSKNFYVPIYVPKRTVHF